eukprot:914307_1
MELNVCLRILIYIRFIVSKFLWTKSMVTSLNILSIISVSNAVVRTICKGPLKCTFASRNTFKNLSATKRITSFASFGFDSSGKSSNATVIGTFLIFSLNKSYLLKKSNTV